MRRTVRAFSEADVDLMIAYFLEADHAFLQGMGVDVPKLPTAQAWRDLVLADMVKPLKERAFYYVAWQLNGESVGHSNINKIAYGEEAFMHLHLWQPLTRRNGAGTDFVQQSISRYFKEFRLKRLLCEPYALNPAPNKTLPKVGFRLIKSYETTPGWLNFQQPVNRWELSRETWMEMRDA